MKLIHDIQERDGVVTGFRSVCGGLPAPEAANNPLKYKFSWSPRGVISASQNAARYREGNTIFEVSFGEVTLYLDMRHLNSNQHKSLIVFS